MAKKVVWTSCTRLACACVSPPPAVIICLTDSNLLIPRQCPNKEEETTYAFTTLEATLTKSWKTQDVCNRTCWSYVFEYDENFLADPATALTSEQIAGVFCEGCLTTWVREEVGNDVEVTLNEEEGTVTITSQHGCETVFSVGGDSPFVDWHIVGNAGIVDGTNFCGTTDDVPFDVRTDNRRSRRTEPHTYTSPTYGDLDAPNILDGSELNTIVDAVSASLLGGGTYAQSSSPNSIVGSGLGSTDIAFGSTIGGGAGNSISPEGPPDFTYVFQGVDQDAFDFGGYSTISGGGDNRISCNNLYGSLGLGFHFIGGGQSNTIENAGGSAVIAGGNINFIGYAEDLLDPFYGNQLAADVIAGGVTNIISGVIPDTGPMAADSIGANFIGSGIANQVDNGFQSVVTGGWDNLVSAVGQAYSFDFMPGPLSYNFIGGGGFNNLDATQICSIVGGAQSKVFGAQCSTIVGGMRNLMFSTTPASPQVSVIDGSSYELNFPANNVAAYHVISGGFGNYIEDGRCSSILGGACLALGNASAGYQSPTTRTLPAPGAATPYSIFLPTVYYQVDLRAFSDLFYIGDADLWIGNTNNTAKKIKFFEPNTDLDFSSANFSSFRAQAQAANIEYIWPAVAGTAGQSLKIAGVAGTTVTLQWA